MENTPLVIIGSARNDGNTHHFVGKIFGQVKYLEINLLDYHILPYNYDGNYAEEDQFNDLVIEILSYKTIVFATPVYWYAMSGLMKNMFDRLTDLVTTRKAIGRNLKGKTVSLIACGTDPELPDGFEIPFKLTAAYLDMDYKQRIYFTEDEKELGEKKLSEIKEFIARLEL
jgi:multimeric flavodoxin WrbA